MRTARVATGLAALLLAGCGLVRPSFSIPATQLNALEVASLKLSAPAWGLGIATPLEPYTYNSKMTGVAYYCTSPDRLMSELRDRIIADSSGNCMVQRGPDLDGGRSLRIVCTLRRTSGGCTDNYSSILWTEQSGASTVDFVLRAFAWARRNCPSPASVAGDSFDKVMSDAELRESIGQESTLWKTFLGGCVPPPAP